MKMFELKGLPQVLSKLKGATTDIKNDAGRGLKKGGLFLQRESQKIVPRQLGNLANSAFTRSQGSGLQTDVTVGYTAEYAAYVHEDLDKAHGKEFNVKHADEIANASKKARTAAGGLFNRGEEQQAKFLETPARTKRTEMLAIIAAEIK